MNLFQDWEPMGLEQALSLLSGYFSLNDEYKGLCVLAGSTGSDAAKRFKKIRQAAVNCLKQNVDSSMIDLISLQLV